MLKYGIENFYIELIEEYPCENSNQLERREGEITRELKASLNQKISGRTMAEYKVEEADKIKKAKAIRDKRYAENNKEQIKAYRKEYYHKDPEKYREQAKSMQKKTGRKSVFEIVNITIRKRQKNSWEKLFKE